MTVIKLLIWAGIMVGCSSPNSHREDGGLAPVPVEKYIGSSSNQPTVDATIGELRRQYMQADRAIVPNDAEKVYIQRFIEGIESKRDKTKR